MKPPRRAPLPVPEVEAAIAEGLEALAQGRVIGPFASMEDYKKFRQERRRNQKAR